MTKTKLYKLVWLLLLLSNQIWGKIYTFLTPDKKDGWQLEICQEDGRCRRLHTQREIDSYDYDPMTRRLVYVGSDKAVRIVEKGRERILLARDKNAYTQPRFLKQREKILVVTLIGGNSRQTRLDVLNLRHPDERTVWVDQHSTALDPWMSDKQGLFYANVSCAGGCGRIIQEIWIAEVPGVTRQITLENRLAHQPAYDERNRMLYYSAQRSDGYGIYRLALDTDRCKGEAVAPREGVSDTWPVPDKAGGLFFLRFDGNLTRIMHLDHRDKLEQVRLAGKYHYIRNLKVYP